MRWILAAVFSVGGFGAAMAQPAPPPDATPGYSVHDVPNAVSEKPATQQQRRDALIERFNVANTSGDGRLTMAQMQAAHLRNLARHFNEIDTSHRGYVTMDDLKAWRRSHAGQGGQGRTGVSRPD